MLARHHFEGLGFVVRCDTWESKCPFPNLLSRGALSLYDHTAGQQGDPLDRIKMAEGPGLFLNAPTLPQLFVHLSANFGQRRPMSFWSSCVVPGWCTRSSSVVLVRQNILVVPLQEVVMHMRRRTPIHLLMTTSAYRRKHVSSSFCAVLRSSGFSLASAMRYYATQCYIRACTRWGFDALGARP